MSPSTTTITLNAEALHSVTYNHTDDTITLHLPDPVPIEKCPNKRRLMVLVYFAQRDQARTTFPNHRRIDAEVSMDVRIVERLIWGYTNIAQGQRTVKEYTHVADFVDTAPGMLPPRTEPDSFGKGTKAIRMTITQDIKNCILEWMRDILAPENAHRRPQETVQTAKEKSKAATRVKKSEVIDLSSPVPETISDDDVQIIHPPAKRKRTKRKVVDEGVLTPGSTISFPAGPRDNRTSPPSTDDFRPLFPSSPIPGPESVAPRPSRSVIEIEDTPFETSEKPSAEGAETSESLEVQDAEMNDFVENAQVGEEEVVDDEEEEEEDEEEDELGPLLVPNSMMQKLVQYSNHLYRHARQGQDDRKLRKYSRKLMRLTRRLQASNGTVVTDPRSG